MFADSAKIFIKSGKGGDGHVSFRRELFVAAGGPDGGDGGRGGDIIFEVDKGLNTLGEFRHTRKYVAESGEEGGKRLCHGKDGADLIIKVPEGTIIKDDTSGKIIADMSGDNMKVTILRGGRGGKGNKNYATATMQVPKYAQPGQQAKELWVRLELKVIADVGLVGFPNVGKSTFINRIAGAARAQVGDRPGVTRSKQWVKVSDYLELLDTPGLLWGKLDNEILAKHLAYIGSIRDDVLDIEEISALLLFDLVRICPEALTARYKKLDPEQNIPELLLEGVCRSRGFILSGGVFDTERGARIVLDEYRAGKIAAVALENPTDNFEPQQAEQTDINNEKD